MLICEYCKKSFTLEYSVTKKRKIKCCSKSCSTKLQRSFSKEDLELKIIDIIKTNNRYTNLTEICKSVKISSKTLNSKKISVPFVNEKAGFIKPKSLFEENVYVNIKSIFKDNIIEREKKFKDLKSSKNYSLSFDFYLPELNLIIEADGNQHYNINNPRYSSYYHSCDTLKDEYCKRKNINIVRIKYNNKVTKKHIMRAFSTHILEELKNKVTI